MTRLKSVVSGFEAQPWSQDLAKSLCVHPVILSEAKDLVMQMCSRLAARFGLALAQRDYLHSMQDKFRSLRPTSGG